MTTLDDVERTLDAGDGAGVRRRGAERHRRDHGRPDLGGVGQDHARADGGGHLGRARTSCAPRRRSGLRTEARARFEKQLHPDQAIAGAAAGGAADGRAVRRALRAGHDRRLPEPGGAARGAAAPRAHGAAARRADPGGAGRARSSSGSASSVAVRRRTSWTRGASPWRDADVQREADLIEEVARIHGLDKLPTTLPARAEAVGRLTAVAAAAPPARGRAARPRPVRDRRLLVHRAARRSSGCGWATSRCCELDNPLSEDQSVMRPLLLPGPARRRAPQRRARPARRWRCSSPRTCTGPPVRSTSAPAGSPRGALPAASAITSRR